MGEWTKEPWRFVPGLRKYDFGICGDYCRNENGWESCVHIIDVLGNETSGKIHAANAARASACVNAMQGIPDPAKFVETFDVMLLELTKWPCDRANSGLEDECVEVLPFDEFCSRCRAIAMALAAKPADPPKDTKCD